MSASSDRFPRVRARSRFAPAGILHVAALALVVAAAAPVARAQEARIVRFDVDVRINPDTTLDVTETIAVTVDGDRIRRGIFRDFPTLNKGPWGLRVEVPFEVRSVERDGRPEPWVVEPVDKGKRIRIGDPNRQLERREHVYTLRYHTGNQLRFFDDHDELYWNATGNYWEFPIDSATVTVRLPEGLAVQSWEAYTGRVGTLGGAYTAEKVDERTVVFRTTDRLDPGEGITVVVTWPPGLLAPPPVPGLVAANWPIFGGLVLLLGVALWHVVAWFRVGRDPAAGLVIPRFEPPEGFSPAACRHLRRMRFDDTAFSAAVIGLAVKKVLRIEDGGGGAKDFRLERTTDSAAPAGLLPDEAKLFSKLLGRTRKSIELKQSNHRRIREARDALKTALANKLEKTHFRRNLRYWLPGLLGTLAAVAIAVIGAPEPPAALFLVAWLTIWSVGTAALVFGAINGWRGGKTGQAVGLTLFALPFLAGWIAGVVMFTMTAGPLIVGLFVIGVLMNVVFYHLIKAPTHCGRKVLDEIEGFREYLSVAEEDRLNLEHPPERTPELFERFLPYALALDCDQQWSEKFASVLAAAAQAPGETRAYRPAWYAGGLTTRELAGGAFASALGGSMAAALAASSQSPSSSSGSGGGGFSGGGGGGGGGGGW